MSDIPERDVLSLQEKIDGEWSPIPRVSRIIPYGYIEDPEDKRRLLPVEIELEALELAKKHVKQYSYRSVAEWLSTETGRYISHSGLRKRLENERKRKSKAAIYAHWANKIAEARDKAEKFSNVLGARQTRD